MHSETTSESSETPGDGSAQRFADALAQLRGKPLGGEALARLGAKAPEASEESGGGEQPSSDEPVEAPEADPGAELSERADAEGEKLSEKAAAASESKSKSEEGTREDSEAEDALLDALEAPQEDQRAKRREERMRARDEVRERAEAAEMPPEVAKVLAASVSEDKAREFIDRWEGLLQSNVAGQTPPGAEAAADAAPSGSVASEVQRLLSEEGSEETAAAVAKLVGQLEARVMQQEERTYASEIRAAQAQIQTEIRAAADGLKGKWPKLVRGDRIDPAVQRRAGALIKGGAYTRAELQAAMDDAASYVYGGTSQPRQDSQHVIETDSPSSPNAFPSEEISDYDRFLRLQQVIQVNPNAKDLQAKLERTAKSIDSHNASVRRAKRRR